MFWIRRLEDGMVPPRDGFGGPFASQKRTSARQQFRDGVWIPFSDLLTQLWDVSSAHLEPRSPLSLQPRARARFGYVVNMALELALSSVDFAGHVRRIISNHCLHGFRRLTFFDEWKRPKQGLPVHVEFRGYGELNAQLNVLREKKREENEAGQQADPALSFSKYLELLADAWHAASLQHTAARAPMPDPSTSGGYAQQRKSPVRVIPVDRLPELPDGCSLATKADVEQDWDAVLARLKRWDICRLAGGLVIDGEGYGNRIYGHDGLVGCQVVHCRFADV